MLNKLKKAVKYIVKKVKQGVRIMAETINDYKCAAAHVAETGINTIGEIKKTKLDMIKSAGSTIKNVCSSGNNRTSFGCILLSIGLGISCVGGGFMVSGKISNDKEV